MCVELRVSRHLIQMVRMIDTSLQQSFLHFSHILIWSFTPIHTYTLFRQSLGAELNIHKFCSGAELDGCIVVYANFGWNTRRLEQLLVGHIGVGTLGQDQIILVS